MKRSSLDEVGEYNKITSSEDVEKEEVLNRVLQKEKDFKKVRRSAWDENTIEDLVDIIINNEVFY